MLQFVFVLCVAVCLPWYFDLLVVASWQVGTSESCALCFSARFDGNSIIHSRLGLGALVRVPFLRRAGVTYS